MADANEHPIWNRLLDLERAFDKYQTQGRLVEAEEARLSIENIHGQQYRQLSLSQELPIGILLSALMDLDRGVVQWILKKASCDQSPHAHDLRAVEFKARCVVLADEISDEQAYKLARDAAAGYGVKMSGKAQIKEWRRQMREQPDGAMASNAEVFRSVVSDLRADKVGDIVQSSRGGAEPLVET